MAEAALEAFGRGIPELDDHLEGLVVELAAAVALERTQLGDDIAAEHAGGAVDALRLAGDAGPEPVSFCLGHGILPFFPFRFADGDSLLLVRETPALLLVGHSAIHPVVAALAFMRGWHSEPLSHFR